MPCLRLGGFIVSLRGRRRVTRCACGRRAPRLCDYRVTARRTCDKPLCRHCATHIDPDEDLCPEHAAQLTLFTFEKGNTPAAEPGG